jgi:hypothetical protein
MVRRAVRREVRLARHPASRARRASAGVDVVGAAATATAVVAAAVAVAAMPAVGQRRPRDGLRRRACALVRTCA